MAMLSGARRFLSTWFGRASEAEEAAPVPEDEERIRLLILFMSEMGAAMNAAGDATTFIRRSLQRIARAYGLQRVGVFVVPTLLLLRYGDEKANFVDLSSGIPTDLRLDQVADLYALAEEAETGRVDPAEGLRRLRRLTHLEPRHSVPTRVAACGLIGAGVALTLRPSLEELLFAALFGLLVGVIRESARRMPEVWPLLPPLAGLVVGVLSLLLIEQGLDAQPLPIIIPALVIFLPGAALTVSMIELSNGDIVAGGSRLAYGMMRLFLLLFGVVLAAQWVDLPLQVPEPAELPYAAYLPIAGVALFTLGVNLHFSAPNGSFHWLLLVVFSAWLGQQAGYVFFGGSLHGFLGGVAMIVVARMIQGQQGAPPLIVSFTPAFWFLVPGALGLEGLSHLVLDEPQAGLREILTMLTTMVSIALGILFGLILAGSSRTREPV